MFDPKKLNIDLDNLENNENINTNDILKDNSISNKKNPEKDKNLKSENIKTLNKDDKKELTNETFLIQRETDKATSFGTPDNVLEDILGDNNSEEKSTYSEYGDMENAPDLLLQNSKNDKDDEKIIFDVNIESLQNILDIIIKNHYNFALIEPESNKIKIVFKKDKVDKETRYIKYPTYSKILLKAKSVTKLEIEGTEDEQQGQGKITINAKDYKIFTKTIPSGYGEKLFLKIEESKIQVSTKVKKKTSIMQLFAFLGAMAFVALVIGGGFLTFIVLNAKKATDVQFFSNMGINLNDINTFIGKTVTIIFSLIIFIETIVLITYLFKFILTKKSYKKKKIQYAIISTLILIISFISGSLWMFIHQKIANLPNWVLESMGNVQIYDNGKLKSKEFDNKSSLIKDTSDLIGPVSIKYDLSYYEKREKRNGFTIKKYIWNIGGETIEKIDPILIYDFVEKGTYNISLEIEETDAVGKSITKPINDLKPVYIGYVVDIKEKEISNGGKIIEFDATSLKEQGEIEWFYGDKLESVHMGELFKPGKPIFKETLVGMGYSNSSDELTKIKKIFIISGDNQNSIKGIIGTKQMVLNDLEYEFKVIKPENNFGEGYIEEFKWIIGEKEIINIGDISSPEKSSKIKFKFTKYGKHNISVILKDSSGKTKRLETSINIQKKLRLDRGINIKNDGEILENIRHNKNNREYFIDELGIPTVLTIDARRIKPDDDLYSLKEISWDIDSNGNIDGKAKTFKYPIDIEGNHELTINYTFVHKRIRDKIIKFKEIIYTEGIKKEALLSLKIEKDSNYAPILVRFDASKSQVKGQNIVKFLWDYGDGTAIEERGSINPGHKYNKSGDYTIKLTVTTEEGNKYSIEKKLILIPKPELAKIDVSMKKAPLGQGIEFSSNLSEGQIEGYYWDFGDGKKAFDANPSHSYKKKGIYKVKLILDFATNNQLSDEITIEIY